MLQILLLLTSAVVALFRGGRFRSLPRFRHSWALFVAAFLQVVSVFSPSFAPVLVSAGYVFIILFVYANIGRAEFRIIFIGVCLNALVIWANGGRMPVEHFVVAAHTLTLPFYQYNAYWHGGLSGRTLLPILGDIIMVRYPVPTLFSCGDIFIFSGAILLIQDLLGVPVKLSLLAGVQK